MRDRVDESQFARAPPMLCSAAFSVATRAAARSSPGRRMRNFSLAELAILLSVSAASFMLEAHALMLLALGMSLVPLVRQHQKIAQLLAAIFVVHMRIEEPLSSSSVQLFSHLLLCGCGSHGRLLVFRMNTARLSYRCIDGDYAGESKKLSSPLKPADVSCARLFLLTFDRGTAVQRLVRKAWLDDQRTRSCFSASGELAMLFHFIGGISLRFPQDLAAGLELVQESLRRCGFADDDAQSVLSSVRRRLRCA
jgi:CPA2 family monovalent cation:H+ antiporter-2